MPEGMFDQCEKSGEATSKKSSHNPKDLVNTFRASSACAPRKVNAQALLNRISEMLHRAVDISFGGHAKHALKLALNPYQWISIGKSASV